MVTGAESASGRPQEGGDSRRPGTVASTRNDLHFSARPGKAALTSLQDEGDPTQTGTAAARARIGSEILGGSGAAADSPARKATAGTAETELQRQAEEFHSVLGNIPLVDSGFEDRVPLHAEGGMLILGDKSNPSAKVIDVTALDDEIADTRERFRSTNKRVIDAAHEVQPDIESIFSPFNGAETTALDARHTVAIERLPIGTPAQVDALYHNQYARAYFLTGKLETSGYSSTGLNHRMGYMGAVLRWDIEDIQGGNITHTTYLDDKGNALEGDDISPAGIKIAYTDAAGKEKIHEQYSCTYETMPEHLRKRLDQGFDGLYLRATEDLLLDTPVLQAFAAGVRPGGVIVSDMRDVITESLGSVASTAKTITLQPGEDFGYSHAGHKINILQAKEAPKNEPAELVSPEDEEIPQTLRVAFPNGRLRTFTYANFMKSDGNPATAFYVDPAMPETVFKISNTFRDISPAGRRRVLEKIDEMQVDYEHLRAAGIHVPDFTADAVLDLQEPVLIPLVAADKIHGQDLYAYLYNNELSPQVQSKLENTFESMVKYVRQTITSGDRFLPEVLSLEQYMMGATAADPDEKIYMIDIAPEGNQKNEEFVYRKGLALTLASIRLSESASDTTFSRSREMFKRELEDLYEVTKEKIKHDPKRIEALDTAHKILLDRLNEAPNTSEELHTELELTDPPPLFHIAHQRLWEPSLPHKQFALRPTIGEGFQDIIGETFGVQSDNNTNGSVAELAMAIAHAKHPDVQAILEQGGSKMITRLRYAQVLSGMKILDLGSGVQLPSFALIAKSLGAEVYTVDNFPLSKDYATRVDGHITVDLTSPEAVQKILESTGGNFDFIGANILSKSPQDPDDFVYADPSRTRAVAKELLGRTGVFFGEGDFYRRAGSAQEALLADTPVEISSYSTKTEIGIPTAKVLEVVALLNQGENANRFTADAQRFAGQFLLRADAQSLQEREDKVVELLTVLGEHAVQNGINELAAKVFTLLPPADRWILYARALDTNTIHPDLIGAMRVDLDTNTQTAQETTVNDQKIIAARLVALTAEALHNYQEFKNPTKKEECRLQALKYKQDYFTVIKNNLWHFSHDEIPGNVTHADKYTYNQRLQVAFARAGLWKEVADLSPVGAAKDKQSELVAKALAGKFTAKDFLHTQFKSEGLRILYWISEQRRGHSVRMPQQRLIDLDNDAHHLIEEIAPELLGKLEVYTNNWVRDLHVTLAGEKFKGAESNYAFRTGIQTDAIQDFRAALLMSNYADNLEATEAGYEVHYDDFSKQLELMEIYVDTHSQPGETFDQAFVRTELKKLHDKFTRFDPDESVYKQFSPQIRFLAEARLASLYHRALPEREEYKSLTRSVTTYWTEFEQHESSSGELAKMATELKAMGYTFIPKWKAYNNGGYIGYQPILASELKERQAHPAQPANDLPVYEQKVSQWIHAAAQLNALYGENRYIVCVTDKTTFHRSGNQTRILTLDGSWRIYDTDINDIRNILDHLDTKGNSLITAPDISKRLDAMMAELNSEDDQETAQNNTNPQVVVVFEN